MTSSGRSRLLRAVQSAYVETERLPADAARAATLAALRRLTAHASRLSTFWRRRLGGRVGDRLDWDAWARLPILTREEARDAGRSLCVDDAFQRPVREAATGGTSGVPVRVLKGEAETLTWEALCIRDELWNRDDWSGTLVRLKGTPRSIFHGVGRMIDSEDGLVLSDWGRPHNLVFATGRMGLMDQKRPVDQQLDFARGLNPDHLFALPSHARLLATHLQCAGETLPLKSVWTSSEAVDDSLRLACAEAFGGARVVSNYSCAEAGYLALQCRRDRLHVAAESVLVEIVDEGGAECRPGEFGRVLVTTLETPITPLLRYELGDEAAWGDPCPCGRTLPVIAEIRGRSGDYLVAADGGRRRVDLNHGSLSAVRSVREFQLVQRGDAVELRVSVTREPSEGELLEIEQSVRVVAGGEFAHSVSLTLDPLERSAAGKLRMFVREAA